ncbi:hypothetical protein ACFQ1M_09840 [Sungkyunkwania multivorans]|uniref:Uncharacterized protein n=1 Tax=Sungkyunkwania multivorans TaxID=1173618 RepID=A0ABW3CXU6_9FLAO
MQSLHDKDSVQVPFKGNNEIKGNVDNHCLDKESPLAPILSVAVGNIYKNTKKIEDPKKANQGAAPRSGHRMRLSENLRARIVDRNELVSELFEGRHDNHLRDLSQAMLRTEVNIGVLSKEMFKVLLVQEVLRICASLFAGRTIYTGCWFNTYDILMDDYFRTNNGSIPNKQDLLREFINIAYRLSRAKKTIRNGDFVLRSNPQTYFNKHNTAHNAFAHTKQWLRQLQQNDKRKAERKKRQDHNAQFHNRRIKEQNQVFAKIVQYMKGTISFDQLFNFIDKKKLLSEAFKGQIGNYITEAAARYSSEAI